MAPSRRRRLISVEDGHRPRPQDGFEPGMEGGDILDGRTADNGTTPGGKSCGDGLQQAIGPVPQTFVISRTAYRSDPPMSSGTLAGCHQVEEMTSIRESPQGA